MTINTCKDCKERRPACHDTCERYKKRIEEYRKEKDMLYRMYQYARSYRTIAEAHKRGF